MAFAYVSLGLKYLSVRGGGNMIDQPGLYDEIPDVRDGLTRKERAVLVCLQEAQRELGGRNVPTVLLYGRVVEKVDMSVEELQQILQRFAGVAGDGHLS